MGLFSKKKIVAGYTDPNTARLLIYRVDKAGKSLPILIDGVTVCTISGRQQKYVDIIPGIHKIAVGNLVETETNITATDAIRIEYDGGIVSSRANLSVVPSEYAMTTHFK